MEPLLEGGQPGISTLLVRKKVHLTENKATSCLYLTLVSVCRMDTVDIRFISLGTSKGKCCAPGRLHGRRRSPRAQGQSEPHQYK